MEMRERLPSEERELKNNNDKQKRIRDSSKEKDQDRWIHDKCTFEDDRHSQDSAKYQRNNR
eukprot:CAMPEP_0176341462 /NCGR_PEP_ID=MMETSP0126-20121128/2389_1 /TAXON_ID=141414 ORGANISM="Strombidinopsis acuminatum, Strain SPMC142" /NCGR_SAMPLE_ID=MMETSP0126 /ASSEMBLY_ACC=CAM_ASM_000229 /LENGTH=60 /DNA_ID=CAMNT_0017686277 /DNA_START=463 /DNA_END=645 /DNA_ORIENTATION=-